MPLGTRVKIDVFTTNEKFLRTIQRCIRGHVDKSVVYYNNHIYEVKFYNHNGFKRRRISIDEV